MTFPKFSGLALAGMLALSLAGTVPASAGTEYLQCLAGFDKVKTYANSIKCKWTSAGFPTRLQANKQAADKVASASCNAHMSAPQKKVWKSSGKWKARVTFLCANIT